MIEIGKSTWPIPKTLFHELGHVIDENSREGIYSKEKLQESSALGTGRFYEWTNTIFERLANRDKFYKKDDAMQLTESGYEALAPLGSMLSSALGISEVEFAKIKDKGRGYEEKLLEEKFGDKNALNNIKEIFDKYELDTGFSLNKKKINQELLNQMYGECLGIMQKRIQTELRNGNIENPEEYKQHQMFYLKKMNFNYKAASKLTGFRFSKNPVIHDIGFCTDNISKKDLQQIASEHIAKTEFGFNDNELNKYSKAMTVQNKDKNSFIQSLKAFTKSIHSKEQTNNFDENIRNQDEDMTR